MSRAYFLVPLCLLAACAHRMEDGYPPLLPLDQILTDAQPGPDPAPDLIARAADLRARAARMRGETSPDASAPSAP